MDIRIRKKVKYSMRMSRVYLILALVIFVLTLYFGFTQYLKFRALRHQNAQFTKSIGNLQNINLELETQSQAMQTAHLESLSQKNENLESVFPSEEELHRLTRELEDYFASKDRANSRMVLSSLDFGKPYIPKVDETSDSGYLVLPMNISIEASEENFFEFLEYLENSGSLEKKTRLMSLESINFSLPQKTTQSEPTPSSSQESDLLRLTLQVNAYLQKNV